MSAQNSERMRPVSGEKLGISGRAQAFGEKIIRRVVGAALVCSAFVCFVVAYRMGLVEAVTGWIVAGTVALLLGLGVPAGHHQYLDVEGRKLVKEKYWYVSLSREEIHLSQFTKIVVRHVCHPGEAVETYTGSVGLKPLAGGSVAWLRMFPASEDEISLEADKFARELAQLTGLPYPGYFPALQPSKELLL